MMMGMEVISIVLVMILIYMTGGGDLIFLFDPPSFIIILVFTVPLLLTGGVWKDFVRGWKLLNKSYTCRLSELRRTQDVVGLMQKQVGYAGILSMLLSAIQILHTLSDPASLGPFCAVAILVVVYAVVIEMLLLPLQMETKRRIIDYMDMDGEEETAAEGSLAEAEVSAGKTEDRQA